MRSTTIKYCVVDKITFEVSSYKFNSIKEFREHLKELFDYSSFYSIVKDIHSVYDETYLLTDLFINGVRVI